MKIYPLNLNDCNTDDIKEIAAIPYDSDYVLSGRLSYDYILIGKAGVNIDISGKKLMSMIDEAVQADAAVVYSDYIDDGGKVRPLIDYNAGSVREGFDFGPLILVNMRMLGEVADALPYYRHAAFYALRLALSRKGPVLHIAQPLYSAQRRYDSPSQFAYQQADKRLEQREMEEAFTAHLKAVGAFISPDDVEKEIEFDDDIPVEASVIIPVRDRVNTVGDAVNSALSQVTDFDFNVIVVDNHSSDGTSELLEYLARRDPRVIHLVPDEQGHGIGGCWNLALDCDRCGRFAVQLDSDDLYSAPDTLQKIVDKFYEEHCPMVIGSYTLTDFDRNVIEPGLIAHREWTDDNGRNNALRVNGLGAPRAFYAPVARKFRFPDVSYGEDYAMGLAISEKYRIGRIYDSLYLCRRWTGNSDAKLTVEAQNANDRYKDSLREAAIMRRQKFVKERCCRKTVSVNGVPWEVRLLPGRAVSTKAKTDSASIAARPCFLCRENRPVGQPSVPHGDYEILENPYPVFPGHLTIPTKLHIPQRLLGRVVDMVEIASSLSGYVVFYNGPRCGASAPDHCHFQAVPDKYLPLNREYPFKSIYLVEDASTVADAIEKEIEALPCEDGEEPPVNVAVRILPDGMAEAVIIPRKAHRPSCYPEIGISPGAIDVLGSIITTSRDDFEAVTPELLSAVFGEVAYPADAPQIEVGLMEAPDVDYELVGQFRKEGTTFVPVSALSRFKLKNVMIGKDFHWQRNLDLTYAGSLEIKEIDGLKIAVNKLSVEDYLRSVITSEMNAAAPLEFLKAHAVISRSWVLSQIGRKNGHKGNQCSVSDDEIVKWYDREKHLHYDVCADDHCQRYQGIPASEPDTVLRAILATRGEALVDEDGSVCDARFSKCCGGVMEEFENCWEPVRHNYLVGVPDAARPLDVPDLTTEEGAREWIMSRPAEPFCARAGARLLSRALNGYDLETPDFYRWTVSYSVDGLSEIVNSRSGIDFGKILDLIPLSRGASGRIYRLKIVGSRRSMIVGKELEIRKWLSRSHLYSSAFVVEKTSGGFVLHGAGWGHGVGLCQIGAAVMADEGYNYREILAHYYNNAKLVRLY